jgi:hypothetical protein
MLIPLVWMQPQRFQGTFSFGGTLMQPIDWNIRRDGRRWSHEEFDQRINQAPEKIEYVDGIFASDRERLIVLGMLLENLGIDKVIRFGRLDDWKTAIEDLEQKQGSKIQNGSGV